MFIQILLDIQRSWSNILTNTSRTSLTNTFTNHFLEHVYGPPLAVERGCSASVFIKVFVKGSSQMCSKCSYTENNRIGNYTNNGKRLTKSKTKLFSCIYKCHNSYFVTLGFFANLGFGVFLYFIMYL